MTRVALTCDFLRYEVNGSSWSNFQLRNLEWLHHLMAGLSGGGLEFARVTPPDDADELRSAMDSPSAVSEYVAGSQYAWAERYDTETLDVFPRLLETLCAYDFVVGFELPPSIRRHLHRNGVKYLNLHVHPLRFLRDLCFSVTTNAPSIARHIEVEGVAPDEIDVQVRRYRALFRRRLLPALAIPHGLPVLVGQTEFDSVLIRDGRFARWSDYHDLLEAELRDFDEIVFLEHPYRPNQGDVVAYLRGVLGKTVVSTNANGYGVLLSAADLPKVVTLSSSLGVEAQAMGYSSTFLVDDPRQKFFLSDIETKVTDAVGHVLLDQRFWHQLLSSDRASASTLGRGADPFFLGDNYVRNSLDAWSYGALQNGIGNLSSRKTLLPSATLSDSRQAELLGQLAQATTPLSPRHALQRAATLGLFLELAAPPVSLYEVSDAPLNVSSPASPLLVGFHAAEPWGCWSSEPLSQVGCAIDPAAIGKSRLVMEIEVAAYEGLLDRAPVLVISFEQAVLGIAFFRTSQPKVTMRIAIRPTSGYCVFDLRFTDLQKPSASGSSLDSRDLGFALSRLTFALEPAEEGGAEAEAPSLWGISATRSVPIAREALA